MSTNTVTRTTSITFPWLIIFLVMKLGGTIVAAWSWWWVLCPIVPVLAVVLQHFGLLS